MLITYNLKAQCTPIWKDLFFLGSHDAMSFATTIQAAAGCTQKKKRQGGGSTRCNDFGLLLQYLPAFRARLARGSSVTTRSTVINNCTAARSASAIISSAVRTHGTPCDRAGGEEDDAAAPGGGLWIGTDWPSEEAPKVLSARVVPCSSGALMVPDKTK